MKVLGEMFLLEGWQNSEKGFLCRLQTNPAHEVYKAHFPSQPVTPGVCLLQLAGELLSEHLQRPLYLKVVKNAKFLTLLIPEEGKRVVCEYISVEQAETECKMQMLVRDEETVYAKFSLIFRYEQC